MDIKQIEQIRGFNYSPGYACIGADTWRHYDAAAIERELGWGVRHFPRMNGLRIWLAWEVFGLGSDTQRQAFLDNLDRVLSIAADLNQPVMPVLFNRWHAGRPEFGGVFLDHFLPNGGWAGEHFDEQWRAYIAAVIGRFGRDPRIFAWDLCNEPYSYAFGRDPDPKWELEKHETRWLADVYAACKEAGAVAPLSVGFAWSRTMAAHLEFCDILNFHAYWLKGRDDMLAPYLESLDEAVALREQTGKVLLCSECCWGDVDDAARARIIEVSLRALNERNIGWMIHALAHSGIADLHRPEYGPVQAAGAMHCVEPDGSLRPCHELINRFMEV